MARIEKTIEIKAPVEKVYACCADVEGYTKFMETAKEIKMTGENKAHWKMEMVGRAMEFDTEMTENIENKKIAWKSAGDMASTGSWRLEPTAEGTTVEYVMDYEMPGIMGKIFDKLKVSKEVEKNMETSLQKMKEFLEG
ncbi:MAG: SRPBCC family protein [Theionarchaea archaeon]|nr:MAG: hypothetical protein AYK19_03360 [Theionarchaea archaeon DG-70-1]MBU7029668.1 SRPBCC family protein [Theionarchaea archaeon]